MIHETAIVDPGARLADDVVVGPFSVIGPDVVVGEGTWIGPHVVINGPTRIGRDNRIYQFASIGEAPQDKSYQGQPTYLELGDRNTVREYATLHRGTERGAQVTRVGNDNYLMAYVHIAHDCLVGSKTVFANCASLGGHVTVADNATLAGFAIVHQYCRVGAYSFCAMGAAVNRDVPPYVIASGHMAGPHGINVQGLKRNEFNGDQIRNLKRAYRILYKANLRLDEAQRKLEDFSQEAPEVGLLVEFLQGSKRSIIR